MAIIKTGPGRKRSPTYRGRFMIDTIRGKIRVRAWPRRRGPAKAPAQLFWIDWFRQANQLAKYADGLAQARAIELTKGWPWYPRDIMISAMRGLLYTWYDQDGWRYFPVAARDAVSESLDSIGQTAGDILARTVDGWRKIVAGTVGQILTSQGLGLQPEWAAPAPTPPLFGGALVTSSGGQAITTGTPTPLNWQVEQYDTDDLHSVSVNISRMTIPAGWSRVRLCGGVIWQNNSVGSRTMFFSKNGTQQPGAATHKKVAILNSEDSINSPVVDCTEDDFFELNVVQDTGGNLSVAGPQASTFFSIERVV